jgi:hypothetical protein
VYASANPGQHGNGVLATAQAYAIKHKLPLSVAHCIETADGEQIIERLNQLKSYEAFLAERNIPFMVLLGGVDTVLPWFISHTTPEKVYDDESEQITGILQEHPYEWPGRVMTIAELIEMVMGDSNYCRPKPPQ